MSKAMSDSIKKAWKNGKYSKVDWVSSGAKTQRGKHRGKTCLSIADMSTRTTRKVLLRLLEHGVGCSVCGWIAGVGDIHHVVSKKKGGKDNHENLVYLCPNCHRLVHMHRLSLDGVPRLAEHFGDRWKEYYYG